MGRKKQFSDMDLNKALAEGLTNKQLAEKFGVAPSSISTRVAALKRRNTGAIIANETKDMVTERLNVLDQLGKINIMANKLMDEATDQEPELKLKCASEIRAQIRLHCDIMESIFSMKQVQLFQDAVIECLDNTDPDMRNEFIRRLNVKKELQGVVTYG